MPWSLTDRKAPFACLISLAALLEALERQGIAWSSVIEVEVALGKIPQNLPLHLAYLPLVASRFCLPGNIPDNWYVVTSQGEKVNSSCTG